MMAPPLAWLLEIALWLLEESVAELLEEVVADLPTDTI